MSDDEGANAAKKRPNIDPDFVRELADLLEETGLTEIEVEEAGTRVRVARQGSPVAANPATASQAAGTGAPAETQAVALGTVITSPMVGTAYLGPAPGAPPFVKAGDNVDEGQTIIIVEAMKTMNQVPSSASGRIVEIYVQDGQPVEFGEPLMRID
jgi:acetyl-CoA carboxylase biotin carboxyl carrier protein